MPYNSDCLTRLCFKGNVFQYRMLFLVSKPYMIKLHLAFNFRRRKTALLFDIIIIIHELKHPVAGDHSHLDHIELIGNDTQRTEDEVEVLDKGEDHSRM